ncbi:amidophosphoribosyltransferase [Cytophaga hutchinsonii]|jgi:amidophosphoribosyltransferase|uniref:Amidophosphoribosyltransferase n=1 Tax=Cytophaga hutchinsonii (strain ATCC 33406 / DSM 1761 / CIP 103989 / NBRC 15051 / NCIMB 9469 / D465) TaxID=269798 RepID=A0A6N4SU07_CYTH3|nr:amidophosphoribosyltransferase [Cytophaga hutchinsonii]ABG59865.1 amidophosphoribosyltransferase [Cytophaga hutchinsonii ATCC 33406]SFX28498.1 amidophosphoribosyltransferase [Cytophaga hutchinsonii ATCC 33406]
MSDAIKHECGIALIRLRKPFSHYVEKYGTPYYGINKLYTLMEKQYNRGQDGAGIAVIKLDVPQGTRYISRYRSVDQQPIAEIFEKVNKKFRKAIRDHKDKINDAQWLLENVAFTGEVLMGHLRYGTHGNNDIENCHPFLRQNNWRSRSMVVAGNFNMTNVDELFNKLIELGQHPKEKVDTVTVLEKIGHFLDEENQFLFEKHKDKFSNSQVSTIIENDLDLQRVLMRSCKDFDGGYAMMGIAGHGAAFVARDPAGIRPAFYYADDEIVIVASERQAIKSAMEKISYEDIKEVQPGFALIIDREGNYEEKQFIDQLPKKSCSFERIYFSRGSDPQIYQERKQLGKILTPQILESIDYDIENTVFSYVPNTAETSFLGMVEGMEEYLARYRKKVISEGISGEELEKVLSLRPRIEKMVIKDAKLRSFITSDDVRQSFVANLYDTTHGVVRRGIDNLVIIDDSIVRGTTLENGILKMLDKLGPKKIIIVSSAPQIRFPDCYGIDMSKVKDFVAFRAMLALLKETKQENLLEDVNEKCKSAIANLSGNMVNHVKELYLQFPYEQVSKKIAEIITPKGCNAEIEVIFQTIEGLHRACPNHIGDWYFTGDYPTTGGNRVVNKAFMYYMEGKTVRAY